MSADKKVRILVADDELAARQRISDMLAGQPDVEIAGFAASGREAVAFIRDHQPDLVFLDIQMPGLTGMQVIQDIGPDRMPAVIFVTAYDQYALKAFDLAALDYLLKPFDDDRFERALDRARKTIALKKVDDLRARLAALLGESPASAETVSPPPRYLERIAVEMRGQLRIVLVEQIDFISASGDYAELHVGEDKFVIREQMQSLEERLDPNRFFRIHRSIIVRMDRIDALLYQAGGDYMVRLKDGRRLKLSRNRRDELEQRLGIQMK